MASPCCESIFSIAVSSPTPSLSLPPPPTLASWTAHSPGHSSGKFQAPSGKPGPEQQGTNYPGCWLEMAMECGPLGAWGQPLPVFHTLTRSRESGWVPQVLHGHRWLRELVAGPTDFSHKHQHEALRTLLLFVSPSSHSLPGPRHPCWRKCWVMCSPGPLKRPLPNRSAAQASFFTPRTTHNTSRASAD